MNHAAIRDGIKLAVRTALGLTAAQYDGRVAWEDESESCSDIEFPKVRMLLDTWMGIGVDETRNPDPSEMDVDNTGDDEDFGSQQVGNRSVVLTIKVESDSACGNASANAVSMQIRTRLKRPGILEILYSVGVSIARIENTQNVPYDDGNRTYVASITDLLLGLVDVDTQDPSAAGTDYFTDVDFQKI